MKGTHEDFGLHFRSAQKSFVNRNRAISRLHPFAWTVASTATYYKSTVSQFFKIFATRNLSSSKKCNFYLFFHL